MQQLVCIAIILTILVRSLNYLRLICLSLNCTVNVAINFFTVAVYLYFQNLQVNDIVMTDQFRLRFKKMHLKNPELHI